MVRPPILVRICKGSNPFTPVTRQHDQQKSGYGEILADALDSGSSGENCAGSSPAIRTNFPESVAQW